MIDTVMRRPARLLLAAAALAIGLAACGDDGAATDPTADGSSTDAPAAEVDDGAADDAAADGTVTADATAEVPSLLPGPDGIDHWDETTVTLGDDAMVVAAKVADTSERRQQGLMRVPELPDGVGMLFLFDQPSTGGFWMRNTLVPLDIAYLADGAVVDIQQMDPCEEDPCPPYPPAQAYDAALEVPQGAFADAGIEVGDAVTWTEPAPVD